MVRLLLGSGFASLLFVAGCGSTPTEELLSVSLGTGTSAAPIQVDTTCGNGGCEKADELDATLHFDDQGGLVDPAAVVELRQYRIDYAFGGLTEPVPFYAAAMSASVAAGKSATVRVRVAGVRQRDFFVQRFGAGEADGRGTVTFEGYDQNNQLVRTGGEFDIAFADFVVTATANDSSDQSAGGGS